MCNINIWNENDPPPFQLFRKFIRFVSAALPLLSIFDNKIKNNRLHELGCPWSVWGKAVFQSLVGKDLLFQTSSWATVTISVWFFSRAALPTGDPDFRNSVLLFPNHQLSTDPTKTLIIPPHIQNVLVMDWRGLWNCRYLMERKKGRKIWPEKYFWQKGYLFRWSKSLIDLWLKNHRWHPI